MDHNLNFSAKGGLSAFHRVHLRCGVGSTQDLNKVSETLHLDPYISIYIFIFIFVHISQG